MPKKFMIPGKVVLVLSGRYAGRKAVILHSHDEPTGDRKYGHAVVVGIDRYPLKVTRAMPKYKVAKRSRIKPFVKTINYAHLMPTRYNLDTNKGGIVQQLQEIVSESGLDKTKSRGTRLRVRKVLETRHKTGQNQWFFTKLRF
jgi:large subunit ribosomal protein L27e